MATETQKCFTCKYSVAMEGIWCLYEHNDKKSFVCASCRHKVRSLLFGNTNAASLKKLGISDENIPKRVVDTKTLLEWLDGRDG